ncbi:MAG: hypothetical protein K0R13_3399 [Propionibacteriaceae bacterium]|jgi:hypothetical protein|nr:hypothetical protein [Propionibacteriaceae bacterium]
MPFSATVYRVLIASPGDVSHERNVVERAIIDWNDEHSRDKFVVFLPVRWERASPRGGAAGQDVVNEDLVDTSDVLIGVFWWRIGTRTREERSGSIEEIRRFARSGRPYGLFFKAGSMPMTHDPEQYAALGLFKNEVRGFESEIRGLTQDFRTRDQLRQYVGRFLTDTARRVSPADREERLERTEVMARAAAIHTNIDHHAGGELDKAQLRQDMALKACLVLASPIRVRQEGMRIAIEASIVNEGRSVARDVKATWDTGDGFQEESDRPLFQAIPPDNFSRPQRFTTGCWVDPPQMSPDGSPVPEQKRRLQLRLTFRDDLGKRDQAFFTVVLHNQKNQGASWRAMEEKSAARLSPLCQFARPEAQ